MNPLAKKEREIPQRVEEIELKGKTKVVSFEVSTEIASAVKEFAIKNDLFFNEAFTLILATGLDALAGDALKPVAKVILPAAFDFIADNTPWIEAKRKRYREILKETRDKIKVGKLE
jgi:hypothetical protein